MKYDAFISYRHAPLDIAVSEQIHRRLERLKIPRSVKKSSGKKRITRVFRDQEELTVSASLSDEILLALDESEYLIVICSLRTQESEWVRNEVEYFIAKHGREKVLPVLIEGEPMQSFPRPLLFEEKRVIDVNGQEFVYEQIAEPFAADFRAATDKQRERIIRAEILRLAAPLLGCRYDDLKQRHRERRNRSVAIVLLALFAATVAFAAYNYWQNQRIMENLRRQQITQSMFLADTSMRLLDSGDRTNAILVALEALPASQTNPDRPIVVKAQYALTQALQAYRDGTDLVPDYSVELDEICSENVKCAPSDAFFVVLDRQGTLYIKDLMTGAHVMTHRASDNGIQGDYYLDFEILSDDRVVAFGSNSTICIDGLTGDVIWEILWPDRVEDPAYNYQYEVSLAVISGDEKTAAVYFQGMDQVILISLDQGDEIRRLSFDDGDLYPSRIALNGNSTQIAFACSSFDDNDPELYVLDTASGEVVYEASGSYSTFHYLDYNPEGQLIAGAYDPFADSSTAGNSNESITMHDISGKEEVFSFDFSTQGILSDPAIVQLKTLSSEDHGESVLLVVDKKIYILDPNSGEIRLEMTSSSSIAGILYNEENGVAIYADVEGEINWINLYDGREYFGADFSITSNLVGLTGGGDYFLMIPMESKQILVFSFIDDSAYEKLETFDELVSGAYNSFTKTSSDGRFICANYTIPANEGGEVTDLAYLIDASSGVCVESVAFDQVVNDCLFLEKSVLFLLEDGSFTRLDLSGGKTEEIDPLDDSGFPDVVASGDGKRIAVGTEDEILIVDSETMDKVTKYKPEEDPEFTRLSYDGSFLVTVNKDKLQSVRLSDGAVTAYDVPLSPDAYKFNIVFSREGSLAAVAGSDKCVYILDLASGKETAAINALVSDIFSGYFLPGNATFVFQSDDTRIRAADIMSSSLVYTGDEFQYIIDTWVFCEKCNTLAAGNSDESILFGINGSIEPIAKIPYFCGFSPNGENLYVLSNETLGKLPYRDLDDLLEMAREEVNGAQLSHENRIKYYVDE